MRFAAPLLVSALLLAGCNAAPSDKPIKEEEAARALEVSGLKGWTKLFSAPDVAIGAANQFGFRATPYTSEARGWRSTGGPVMIAGSTAKTPNKVAFTALGPSARQVDTITFDLSITDPATAVDARKRFAKLVRDYLFQAQIEGDALIPALELGVPARGTLAGTPYSIENLEPVDDSEDHLAITFIRSGASNAAAPDNSQAQGN